MGEHACYTDHYWARLAGTQIVAQVETEEGENPQRTWEKIPDKGKVVRALRGMGLRYLVSTFPNSVDKPAGWVKLGSSDFFAYPLQEPLPEDVARAIGDLQPTP